MAWNIKAALQSLTAQESGVTVKDPGGRLSVALVWPGRYRAGMSALGYLSIYGLLNSRPDVLAERFFLPDGELARLYEKGGGPLLSLESARPLVDFELVAASLSLENDYWMFLDILARGGLSPRRAERPDDAPLVLAGGVAVWANPWPLADFADLILAGEAEAQWPRLISAWRDIRFSSLPKPDRLRQLCRKTPGALWPGSMAGSPVPPTGEPAPLTPAADLPVRPAALKWPPPPDLLPPASPILSPKAEFAGSRLVEISRGCPYGCRFCLAGFLFRPHRPWPLDRILTALGPPGAAGEKVGLISPAAADHPDLDELLGVLLDQGRQVTLSSMRLTAITPELAGRLAAGRVQGLAVAPEGGSQRLRDIINKNLTESQILDGARLLSEAGLKKLKLYFMLGLPRESDEDLEALVDLCRKIRQVTLKGKSGPELAVSLANFTPKPQTPFEEAPLATEAEFRRKGVLVSAGLKSLPRLACNLDSPKWSIVQGLLCRGGAESGRLVEALWRHQGRPGPSLAEVGYTAEHPIHRPWAGPKPWRVIAPACGFENLEREGRLDKPSPPCPPANGCGRCRACD